MAVAPGDREPRSMVIDQQDRQALPSGKIGYDEWMPMKNEDRSNVGCCRQKDRCRRTIQGFESKPSRGLRKGSAACRWMDGLNGRWRSINRKVSTEDRLCADGNEVNVGSFRWNVSMSMIDTEDGNETIDAEEAMNVGSFG